MSRAAANILSAQVILKPNSVLGCATGSSPLGVYKQLIEWYRKGDISFSEATTINLDEYVGLSGDNPNSYLYFMKANFFDHVDADPGRTNIPDGMAPDSDVECRRYEDVIKGSGGIDMQFLGLGYNGHIGFNEPGAEFEKNTHCVELSASTIRANVRFFGSEEDVPRLAYTVGIRSIMHARRIVIIVSGEKKAEIVKTAFFGKITPIVPASILQLHNDVTLVADEGALSLL